MTEWYRRKSWTGIDEEEFFRKLARARKGSRSQYLKIQAIELVSTKDPSLLGVAELLLNKVLVEFPDDSFNKSSVLNTLGDIYKEQGSYAQAINFYRQSLDFEKNYKKVITTSYLDFSELVVKTGRHDMFDFVEHVLEGEISKQSYIFPVAKYKIFSLLAVINKFKQDLTKAKHYAELANINANAETSGLQYHKFLGLVTERESWLDALVKDP